VPPVAEW